MRSKSPVAVIAIVIALSLLGIVSSVSAAENWLLTNQEGVPGNLQEIGNIVWGGYYSGAAEAGAFNMLVQEYAVAGDATSQLLSSYQTFTYCMDGHFFYGSDWFDRFVGGIPGEGGHGTQNPPLTENAWKTIVWMNDQYYFDSLTSREKSVGYQLAIWEVVNDFGGTMDLTAGNFQASGFSMGSLGFAQSYLTGLGQASDYSQQRYYADGQNMLDAPPAVPEPFTMVLGTLGFGAVAGLKRLRRKSN